MITTIVELARKIHICKIPHDKIKRYSFPINLLGIDLHIDTNKLTDDKHEAFVTGGFVCQQVYKREWESDIDVWYTDKTPNVKKKWRKRLLPSEFVNFPLNVHVSKKEMQEYFLFLLQAIQ